MQYFFLFFNIGVRNDNSHYLFWPLGTSLHWCWMALFREIVTALISSTSIDILLSENGRFEGSLPGACCSTDSCLGRFFQIGFLKIRRDSQKHNSAELIFSQIGKYLLGRVKPYFCQPLDHPSPFYLESWQL